MCRQICSTVCGNFIRFPLVYLQQNSPCLNTPTIASPHISCIQYSHDNSKLHKRAHTSRGNFCSWQQESLCLRRRSPILTAVTTTTFTGYIQYREGQIMLSLCVKESWQEWGQKTSGINGSGTCASVGITVSIFTKNVKGVLLQ
jgi:hypothetical protein